MPGAPGGRESQIRSPEGTLRWGRCRPDTGTHLLLDPQRPWGTDLVHGGPNGRSHLTASASLGGDRPVLGQDRVL